MSSSEEDIMLIAAVIARRRKRKKRTRIWIQPYLQENVETHSVSQKLQMHSKKFQDFYGMEKETFLKLVELMRPTLQLKDTNYRRAITVEERLLIFLRFLATGRKFSALHFEFFRGVSTISTIVADTARKLWTVLQPMFMSLPTREQWKDISDRYYELWNMPNCLGSLDGKHIRIKYHQKSSVVLMASADAEGCFTLINVGDYGRKSDVCALRSSGFIYVLTDNQLDIPPPAILPNDSDTSPFPMFFVGVEAFPLNENIMRPYSKRTLNNDKRVFNYRLSRARKSVEFAFGMLVSKFKIFQTEIECEPDKVVDIVKAACVLHNFILKHDGPLLNTSNQDFSASYILLGLQQGHQGRQPTTAIDLRDHLCAYFVRPENAIPLQNVFI